MEQEQSRRSEQSRPRQTGRREAARRRAEERRLAPIMKALKAVHTATSPSPWTGRTWSASAKGRRCWAA